MKTVSIVKRSGETAPYDPLKLKVSLERSGASESVIQAILDEVDDVIHEGMTTRALYKIAFKRLKKRSAAIAAKYKLKEAVRELGPTGYPFENFVGALLREQGFDIEVGVIVDGHCVSHEVDVVAEKDDKHFMIECKFHHEYNRKCNVQVPLYIQSRFLDVKRKWEQMPGHGKGEKFHQGWVVTNTRFSADAIQYGNCMNLQLIGWDHPKHGNLKDRIDNSGLHPITCMTTLSSKNKELLLKEGHVLSRSICDNPDILQNIGMRQKQIERSMAEARELCALTNI